MFFHILERITWPNALAVDLYAEKLYWADAFLDVIELVFVLLPQIFIALVIYTMR